MSKKEFTQFAILCSLATVMFASVGCGMMGAHHGSEKNSGSAAGECKPSAPVVPSQPGEIVQRAAEAFTSAPGLTAEQKQKLAVIYKSTYAEAVSVRTQIVDLKTKMFRLVATKSYQSKEVEELKMKIVALDQHRLDVMFKSLADVQAVVGFGQDKEEIYRHLRDFEIQRNHDQMSI